MRLAVFGGTGRVGRRVVEYARAAGHEVVTLVREPGGLADAPGLAAIPGDVLSADDVARVLDGADAVISALGSPSVDRPGTILSGGMRNITGVMRRLGIRRVLAVAGSGVLDAPEGGLRHDRADFPATFRAISEEHAGTWAALRTSRLDWTLACCPTLVAGVRTGQYLEAADVMPAGGRDEIAHEDVADFLLREMTAHQYPMRRVGITY